MTIMFPAVTHSPVTRCVLSARVFGQDTFGQNRSQLQALLIGTCFVWEEKVYGVSVVGGVLP